MLMDSVSAFVIPCPVRVLVGILLLLLLNLIHVIIMSVHLEFSFVQKHTASSFWRYLGAQLS